MVIYDVYLVIRITITDHTTESLKRRGIVVANALFASTAIVYVVFTLLMRSIQQI